MLDYALGLLSYWSAVCKIVGFFSEILFCNRTCVAREKCISRVSPQSYTLRFHPHSRPFHRPLARAILTWANIRAVLQSIWGVVLPD